MLLRSGQQLELDTLARAVQESITDLRIAHPPSPDPFLSASLAVLRISPGELTARSQQEQARWWLARAEELLAQARQASGPAIRSL